MWGTSYSGFNSLQIACERPPALKAICAIYASDDRWTDDVHWRGGALRLVDLVDYCHYMTPMYVLPPVPAVWGDGLARGVAAAAGDQRAVGADLAAGEPRTAPTGGTARCGSAATGDGYERIDCPVMIVAGWADGYRNNSFRTVERARRGTACRTGCSPARGRTPTRPPRCPGPRIDLDARDGRLVRPLAARPRRRRSDRTAATSSCAPRPGPSPTSTCTRAAGSATPGRRRAARGGRPTLDGTAVARRRARRRHRRLDRLRRPPAVGAVRRPARSTTRAR